MARQLGQLTDDMKELTNVVDEWPANAHTMHTKRMVKERGITPGALCSTWDAFMHQIQC